MYLVHVSCVRILCMCLMHISGVRILCMCLAHISGVRILCMCLAHTSRICISCTHIVYLSARKASQTAQVIPSACMRMRVCSSMFTKCVYNMRHISCTRAHSMMPGAVTCKGTLSLSITHTQITSHTHTHTHHTHKHTLILKHPCFLSFSCSFAVHVFESSMRRDEQ
jgi:hypothetical protein